MQERCRLPLGHVDVAALVHELCMGNFYLVIIVDKYSYTFWYRQASLLKQQTSFTVYCLSNKENKRLFSVLSATKKQKFAISVFRLHKTIGGHSVRYL